MFNPKATCIRMAQSQEQRETPASPTLTVRTSSLPLRGEHVWFDASIFCTSGKWMTIKMFINFTELSGRPAV